MSQQRAGQPDNPAAFSRITVRFWPTLIVVGLIALYIVAFAVLATRRHLAFESGMFDLGNYDQAMWNAAQGRGLALTTVPTLALNRMGLHVEPILFLFVPLYWLWPSPLVLLWLQTLALGLAAWPLYLLARRHLWSDWAAVVIVLAYLLLPATQSVNMFDFHAVALSPFFMLWAIYFLDNALRADVRKTGFLWLGIKPPHRRGEVEADVPLPNRERGKGDGGNRLSKILYSDYVLAGIFFILAMATKEDISLHVFMIGLYAIIFLRRRRIGTTLLVGGLIWAFVAFGVIIPANRVDGEQSAYVDYFPTLGETPLEIALSPIARPGEFFRALNTQENVAALGMLTAPFAFLNLVGLPVFALMAPTLAISFLSNNPLQKELESWHYAAPILPFVALATVDGLARLRSWFGRRRPWIAPALLLTLLLASTGYQYLRGYTPFSKPFHWPALTAHHQLGREIAASIPTEASVIVQAELGPHFTHREQVAVWTGEIPAGADYVIMDVSHPEFPNRDNAHTNFLSTMVFAKPFGFELTKDGFIVLRRGAERIPTQVGFQTFLFGDDHWRRQPELAQFGDWLSLVGIETHTNRGAEAQVTLYFHVLQKPVQDYFVHLYLLNQAQTPVGATIVPQPALVWWPVSNWQTGDVIKVRFNTLNWWTDDGRQEQFSYAVAVLTADAPWDVSSRLPVRGERAIGGGLAYLHPFRRLAGMVYPIDKAAGQASKAKGDLP